MDLQRKILLFLILVIFVGGCGVSSREITAFSAKTVPIPDTPLNVENVSMQWGACKYGKFYFDTEAFADIAEMRGAANRLSDFVEIISIELKGVTPSAVNIYVLSDGRIGAPFFSGDSVYVRKSDMGSFASRAAIVNAAFRVAEPKIGYMLAGYVFGENVDEEAVRDYLTDAPDLDMTAFFPDRFVPGVYGDNEANIARMAAASVGKFVVAEYGPGSLISKELDDTAMSDWLNSIGVPRLYYSRITDSANTFYAKDWTFSTSPDYALILSNSKTGVTYYVADSGIFSGEDDASSLDSFVFRDSIAREYVSEFFSKNSGNKTGFINTAPGVSNVYLKNGKSGWEFTDGDLTFTGDGFRSHVSALVRAKLRLSENDVAEDGNITWLTNSLGDAVGYNINTHYKNSGWWEIFTQETEQALEEEIKSVSDWTTNSDWRKLSRESAILFNYRATYKNFSGRIPRALTGDSLQRRAETIDMVNTATLQQLSVKYAFRDILPQTSGFDKMKLMGDDLKEINESPVSMSESTSAAFLNYLLNSSAHGLEKILTLYTNGFDFEDAFGRSFLDLAFEWERNLDVV